MAAAAPVVWAWTRAQRRSVCTVPSQSPSLSILGLLTMAPSAQAIDFPVNQFDDAGDGTCDGTCTLRDAIDDANALAGADRVTFTAGGVITTASPLTVSEELDIDGTSVPGYTAGDDPPVEIDGNGAVATGIVVNGDDSEIRALSIYRFSTTQVLLEGTGSALESSWIGVRASDSSTFAATGDGVLITDDNSFVGGSTSTTGNVISGQTTGSTWTSTPTPTRFSSTASERRRMARAPRPTTEARDPHLRRRCEHHRRLRGRRGQRDLRPSRQRHRDGPHRQRR